MLYQFAEPLKQNDFNNLVFFANAYWLSHGRVTKTNCTVNLDIK